MHESVAHILSALNEADPEQLRPGAPGEVPADEYLPEAEELADHLNQHGTIDTTTLDGIWHTWFNTTLRQRLGTAATAELAARLRGRP